MENLSQVKAGFSRWASTQKMLRSNKKTEFLSRGLSDEERVTQILIGALTEFGKEVLVKCDVSVDIPSVLEDFLRARGVNPNPAPNFQWERECLREIPREDFYATT